jgi:hypothetical protein
MELFWIAALCAAGVSHVLDFSTEWIRPFDIVAIAIVVPSP